MTGALALPVFTERRENNMRPRDMRFRMVGADAVRDPTRAALHLTPSGDAELRGTVYQGTHTHTAKQSFPRRDMPMSRSDLSRTS